MLLRASVGTAAPQAPCRRSGAAELVGAALEALAADADLLAAERARVRLLLVDDAQHLDPQAAAAGAGAGRRRDLAVLAGDPQSGGASVSAAPTRNCCARCDDTITLTRSHRCAPAIARAICRDGRRAARHRRGARSTAPSRADDGDGGRERVTVRVADVRARRGRADRRRAAPRPSRRRGAVVATGGDRALGLRGRRRCRRSLAVAGVPVRSAAARRSDRRPARGPCAADRAGGHRRAGSTATGRVALLTGPIGRVDPVSLRQLRRALRRHRRRPGRVRRSPVRPRSCRRRWPARQAGARGAGRRRPQPPQPP